VGDTARVASRAIPSPIPEPVSAELVRSALVEQLQRRFASPVTTVVAGAGFGKSTAIAQAARLNVVAPLGIDAWVSCGQGHENAEQLTESILAALEAVRDHRVPAADDLVSAIVGRSPLDVCVILDDCHVVPNGSSSEQLLGHFLRRLPTNGHVLLCGRRLPDVPLARLKAAARVIEVGADDLSFTPAEVSAASELLDRDGAKAQDVGGWPALVRLALVAPSGVDREFLREEMLGELPESLRRALVALVVLGPATEHEVREITGEPVNLAALAERLPLISATSNGRYTAHQLWEDAAVATLSADQLTALRRRAHEVLLQSGELPRAGAMAIANEDWDALGRTAVQLVSRSLTHLPSDTARNWIDRVPPGYDSPSIKLLDAAVRYEDDTRDTSIDALLDDILASEEEDFTREVEVAALAMAALVAHGRNDMSRLLPLAVRATELSSRVDEPVLKLLASALPAIAADLRGDPEAVLEVFETVPWGRLPYEIEMTAQRLRLQAMWMSGRASESIELADRAFGQAHDNRIRVLPTLARWFAGDPQGLVRLGSGIFEAEGNERDRFVAACFLTVMFASAGGDEQIDRIWKEVPVASLAFDNARDSAHLTYAMAARAVVEHDDASARVHFARHLERYPVTDSLGERHLRRWPALGYVLSTDLHAFWDEAELGPSHRMARECARCLLDARAGRSTDDAPTPAQLFTQLPLPWSMELASRWHAEGDRRGLGLAAFVVDLVGGRARAELRHVAKNSGETGASGLLRGLAPVPTEHLTIRVLGPLHLERGVVRLAGAPLRRARVRQLLTLLVAQRVVRRDQVLEMLWPDMSPDAASQNLRVTLAHLRRLIEPERASGDPGFHLRTDSTTIELHQSSHLTVDLWRWNEVQAELVRSGHDPNRDQSLLTEAASLWRGDPLDDLTSVPEMEPLIEHLRLQHVASLLRLGELEIAAGNATAALHCSQRVLDVAPYSEQGHRLAIAALIHIDDPSGVAKALQRLDAALDDLAVEAEAATEVLRRQAAWRYGTRLTS
jgi:LuxR family transcriptional regulator, maltose regulon positive regulatory protein